MPVERFSARNPCCLDRFDGDCLLLKKLKMGLTIYIYIYNLFALISARNNERIDKMEAVAIVSITIVAIIAILRKDH